MKFEGSERKVVLVEILKEDDQVFGYNTNGRYWAKFYELDDDQISVDNGTEVYGAFYNDLAKLQKDIDEWIEEDI